MIKALAAVVTAGLGVAFVPAVAVLALLGSSVGGTGPCLPGGSLTVTTAARPASVAGYSGDQLLNASVIITSGADLAVPARGQVIAVMTAMGESSLRVVDHGDTAGPDSRGLFQQRDNGAWGTYADRMNPTASAAMFYRALLAVPDWETLEPTLAAHAVQRNADPNHYTRFWEPALELVAALTGATVTADAVACGSGVAAVVGPDGWATPAVGKITSGFGMRVHPITGARTLHAGVDIANRCGTPVHAAATGTVTWAGGAHQGRTGNQIVIDHGNGLITRYGHLLTGTLTVRAGDAVTAGQQIASMGGDKTLDPTGAGNSTGCHLHFEINIESGRTPIDPLSRPQR